MLLPGWLDSGPTHWQSRWEARHGWRRVTQSDWLWPRRGDWMARLEDMPPNLHGWRPIVRQALPFGSIAVTSSDDPYSAPERSARLVREWGARQVDIGAAGHINGESGLADWPAGQALARSLMSDRQPQPQPQGA